MREILNKSSELMAVLTILFQFPLANSRVNLLQYANILIFPECFSRVFLEFNSSTSINFK